MENQNSKIENVESAKVQKSESAKVKNPKVKKSEKSDAINFDKIKINVKKSDKKLADVERSTSANKSIYIGLEKLSEREKKIFRGKIRRKLDNYVSDILGKDRTDQERTDAIKNFLSFYKKNWIRTDFKIESFTLKKNEADIKDYKNLLKFVSQSLEK